jgi:C1A family cysteine protease
MIGDGRIASRPVAFYFLFFTVADRSWASIAEGPGVKENTVQRLHSPNVYEKEFEAFKQRYSKTYESAEDEEAHFEAFMANYDVVEAHRSKNASYSLEINAFSDVTPEEFARTHKSYQPLNLSEEEMAVLGVHEYSGNSLPSSVDWRGAGAASHVKNQQQCGGCWAFSANAAVEGAWYLATNKTQSLSLSEEQLIDCTPESNGCDGGNPYYAWKYMSANGVCTQGSYPFTSAGGKAKACQKDCTEAIPKGGIKGSLRVSAGSSQALMEAVSKQPVAVAIDADNPQFSQYSTGVWSNCGTQLDHSVLLVGYGTEGNTPYWLIQNSWGTSWGQGGFGKILRQAGNSRTVGTCGILTEAQFPVVDGAKALPGMNPTPFATYALIAGAIAFGLAVIICIFIFAKKKCKSSRTVSTARVARPIPIPPVNTRAAPLVGSTPRLETSSTPANAPKGNSRQSRLVT